MRKGFTLIELLAVIVILAIIALIATPIVLNIIKDSKENSQLRSAEMYLKGVETSVATAIIHEQNIEDRTYPIMSDGNICLGTITDNKCKKEETLVVEMNGETPQSGSITIASGKVTDLSFTYKNGKTIVKDAGKLVYREKEEDTSDSDENTLATLCTLADGYTANTIGAKYTCDFGVGNKNFYILELGTNPVSNTTLESDEVALILEGNYDTTTQYWCAQNGANPSNNVCAADGLTAKLDEIAGAWTKLERAQIGLPSGEQLSVADGKSETAYTGWITLSNSWIYNWPDNANYNGSSVPHGYWTSSPRVGDSDIAWFVGYGGGITVSNVNYGDYVGVRPVVNLKI